MYAQQRLRGSALPTEEIFLQCGHFARVLNLSSIHRNVFPQCPHTTLVPSGWIGNAGWAGCSSEISITGPRLIIRLQLGLGHPIRRDVSLQMRRQLQGHLTYFFPVGGFLIGVASLQTVHLTTCWWSLPSKLISDWHTRQFITGIPLASGLAMAVYGGGSSVCFLKICSFFQKNPLRRQLEILYNCLLFCPCSDRYKGFVLFCFFTSLYGFSTSELIWGSWQLLFLH